MPAAAGVKWRTMTTDLTPLWEGGTTPLLVSVPHAGTEVTPEVAARLTPAARALPDTDWFVDRLYRAAVDLGAGLLVARVSRYLVDVNRPPDDAPLYDRSATRLVTGLVPTQDFDGRPLYRDEAAPQSTEAVERIESFWRPYHQRLEAELNRIRERHGHAVLLDAHSIRHAVPLLFEGELPDLNLGTDDGRSVAPDLRDAAAEILRDSPFSMVVDGRFKGGYITRHYGRPAEGVHALQLEIAQRAYMNENPPCWNPARAGRLQPVLHRLIERLVEWRPAGG